MIHTWLWKALALTQKLGIYYGPAPRFSADTGPLFAANVYSPEEQIFYTKVGSSVEAWSFSDPSVPPTLAWTTYVPGAGEDSSGITYGDGMVFPGSFLNEQMALNARTGAILWTTPTKGPMIFSGSYYEGRFIRGGTDDDTVTCFNATNGQILWTYTPNTDGYFTAGCAVAYGMVYAPQQRRKSLRYKRRNWQSIMEIPRARSHLYFQETPRLRTAWCMQQQVKMHSTLARWAPPSLHV